MMLKKILLNQYNYLYVVLLIVFFYPTNNNLFFDGLIFDKIYEIFLILFLLPLFFLIVKFKYIYFKNLIFILILFLIFIKIFFILIPDQHINVNPKLTINDTLNQINKIEVFNKNNFYVQKNYKLIKNDLKNSKQFPLEWINYIDPKNGSFFFLSNPKEMASKTNCSKNDLECEIYKKSKISDYNISFYVSAYVLIEENQNFIIYSKGKVKHNLKLILNDYEENLTVIDEINENILKHKPYLKKGLYKLEGEIEFFSGNFSFIPYLIDNKKIISAFDNNNIYENNKISFFLKDTINILTYFFNFIFIFLLIILKFNIFKNLLLSLPFGIFKYQYLLTIFSLVFFGLFNFFNFELITNKSVFYEIFSGSFLISLFLLILLINYFFLNKNQISVINIRKIQYVSFFIFFPILTYFFTYWLNDIFNFSIHLKGNDWHTIQYFAFRIGTLGEYLRAGEDIFYFRPLARYLAFFTNFLFGQNFFANKFIEIWFIILSGLFVMKIILLNTKDIRISFIALFILCILYFGETFKFLIGKQLSEFPSLLFLLMNLYFLNYYSLNNIREFKKFFYILLFGVLCIFFRENHLPILLAGISIYFIKEIPNNKLSNFDLINFFLKKYKFIFSYFLIILFFFFLIYVRNYYLSGSFFYQDSGNVSNLHPNIKFSINNSLKSMYVLLTGSLISEIPRTFILINILAIFFAIYSLITKQKKDVKIFSSLIIISIIPYLFLNIHGYRPRYSIQILPYSIMFLSIFWSNIKRQTE